MVPCMASLAEIGVRNRLAAGDKLWLAMMTTSQAVSFVITWSCTTRKLGRPPTQVEYATEWKCNERTVRRDVERFRITYPGADLNEVAGWLIAQGGRWLDDRAKALEAPAPGWLVTA